MRLSRMLGLIVASLIVSFAGAASAASISMTPDQAVVTSTIGYDFSLSLDAGDSVTGTANWTLYPCSTGAFFEGVLTGTSLVGTLKSFKFMSEADFSLQATWNPGLGTLGGPWTITKTGQLVLCNAGETGNMDLTLLTLPLAEPDPPPTHTTVYLGVESDGTQQEILIRNR